jgi:hypothetical protein
MAIKQSVLNNVGNVPREYLQFLLNNSVEGEIINIYMATTDNDIYLATDKMELNLEIYVKDKQKELFDEIGKKLNVESEMLTLKHVKKRKK